MARFYLPPEQWDAPHPLLSGDEARHASKVLRLKPGDSCTVFDGKGRCAHARIADIASPGEVEMEIGQPIPQEGGLPEIILCQAIPKGGNMDLIIQKAVELGVSNIIPLITEHTIVRLTSKEAEAKRAKWQRTALEACKQCGQNTLPAVELPIRFESWIADYSPPPVSIIASLTPQAKPIRNILEQARLSHCRKAAILVGPEGDFSAKETEQSLQAGFTPVTLGPIILRVETAAFFCLSALRYALDQPPAHV